MELLIISRIKIYRKLPIYLTAYTYKTTAQTSKQEGSKDQRSDNTSTDKDTRIDIGRIPHFPKERIWHFPKKHTLICFIIFK